MTEKTNQTPANNEESINANTEKAQKSAEKSLESEKKANENNGVTPNYNIRNARIADVNYIKSFAVNGKTLSEALNEVVKMAQAPQVSGVVLAEDEEIIKVTEQLLEFAQADEKTVNDTVHRLMMEYIRLTAENERLQEKLKSKEPKAGERTITFDEKTAENIRKVRPFISRDNYIAYEKNNETDFLNKLVNHAINKVFRIDFDNIVNPL